MSTVSKRIRFRNLPAETRFWLQVDKSESCWNWIGAKGRSNYGKLLVDRAHKAAHRFAYELLRGPIPAGSIVAHRCDNPRCVNPDHLFLTTYKGNSEDMVQKGRASRWRASLTHCKRGHPFTPQNTLIRTRKAARCAGYTYRHCRECAKERNVAR